MWGGGEGGEKERKGRLDVLASAAGEIEIVAAAGAVVLVTAHASSSTAGVIVLGSSAAAAVFGGVLQKNGFSVLVRYMLGQS